MGIETLTGLNKAAVLLICLGEDATARIFPNCPTTRSVR